MFNLNVKNVYDIWKHNVKYLLNIFNFLMTIEIQYFWFIIRSTYAVP
jgi:hypothetical protein